MNPEIPGQPPEGARGAGPQSKGQRGAPSSQSHSSPAAHPGLLVETPLRQSREHPPTSSCLLCQAGEGSCSPALQATPLAQEHPWGPSAVLPSLPAVSPFRTPHWASASSASASDQAGRLPSSSHRYPLRISPVGTLTPLWALHAAHWAPLTSPGLQRPFPGPRPAPCLQRTPPARRPGLPGLTRSFLLPGPRPGGVPTPLQGCHLPLGASWGAPGRLPAAPSALPFCAPTRVSAPRPLLGAPGRRPRVGERAGTHVCARAARPAC